MAIRLEFINFIVPIAKIKDKYPGGWKQCLLDRQNLIGGRVWYDDYLLRDGAMNPADIGALVSEWQELGFDTHETDRDGYAIKWLDVCVVEAAFGGATLPCDWIEVDGQTAYLRSTPRGRLIGREDFTME